MLWKGRRQSENVEDRRGMPGGRGALVGGGIGTLVIALIVMFMGGDPTAILQQAQQAPTSTPADSGQPYQETPEEQETREFVSVVLADTEDVWTTVFQQGGEQYVKPKLVLFSGAVDSGCGMAQSAMGPFYCPADQRVFIDLSFYDDMRTKMGAGGDFAQAYVIAHEVGHHVQNLLGTSGQVQQRRQGASEAESNALSVRLELQADCYAGVWANRTQAQKQVLESGDIEEALNAASAVGDDRLQEQARGYVTPDSFTHGSSAQRVKWFKRGFERGDVASCNTFEARDL
jgi:predicted metalloprotease